VGTLECGRSSLWTILEIDESRLELELNILENKRRAMIDQRKEEVMKRLDDDLPF
jgi:hypothetical protein